MSVNVNVKMDGRAHTIIPYHGGEVWVERCTDDLFQLGAVDSDEHETHKWACADLTREELITLRGRIDLALA